MADTVSMNGQLDARPKKRFPDQAEVRVHRTHSRTNSSTSSDDSAFACRTNHIDSSIHCNGKISSDTESVDMVDQSDTRSDRGYSSSTLCEDVGVAQMDSWATGSSYAFNSESDEVMEIEYNIAVRQTRKNEPPRTLNLKQTSGKSMEFGESSVKKLTFRSPAKPEKPSLLLRLFESKMFDMSMAIGYLFTSKEPGVQTYLGKYWDYVCVIYFSNSELKSLSAIHHLTVVCHFHLSS